MIIRLRRLITGDGGQGAIPILVAVVSLGIVLYLVIRTEAVAGRIFKKADSIDRNAITINNATDAVLKLKHTNAVADSIYETAKPLEAKVTVILNTAKSIDGLATSIDGTAAGIVGTARQINDQAGSILGHASSINAGVTEINQSLNSTVSLANGIKGDTGSIVVEATNIQHNLARVDGGLPITRGSGKGEDVH
jgi:methyl-accepting chemotaxis protein